MNEHKKLFLLDSFALIYRAYFAFAKNPRINSKGLDTSAIFGFTNSLIEVIKKQKPSHLAVVFDTKKPTQRHIDFPSYKAHREAMPEGISEALPYIDKLLKVLGIPKIYKDGFEADDVIGTLAKKAEKEGFQVFMMTSDKDFAQLVSENIFMFRPGNKWQPTETWGIKEVLDKFSIKKVSQVIDFLAMMGDAADNIPGISGVGKKTAQKFIAEYDSVEGLFANVDSLRGKIKEKVIASKEIGLLSKKLVTIITDVPVEFDENKMLLNLDNPDAVLEFFSELEFRNVFDRLFKKQDTSRVITEDKLTGDIQKLATDQIDLFSNKNNQINNKENIKLIDANHLICKTEGELRDFLKVAVNENELTFNTVINEVNNKKDILGISIKFCTDQIMYIPLNDKNKLSYLHLLMQLFDNQKFTKISYNIKEQIKSLSKYGINLSGDIFDTAIAHYILHPDLRHNLDLISENYLGVSLEVDIKKTGKNKYTFSELSVESLSFRFNSQVDIIYKLHSIFKEELNKNGVVKLFNDIEMPLLKVLSNMELEGVNLDVDMLSIYSVDLEKIALHTTSLIHSLAETKFNISSPKQLGEVLFEKMQLVKKPKKTKSGQYSTSEETLQKIRGEHKIIDYILDYREVKKLLSTYVNALPEIIDINTKRIHTTFNQSVASTGRLSSVRPNLQNIPIRTDRGMKIREAFIPRKGCILLAADYSQIELRIMASLSKDKSMIEAFNNGLDIHSATAAKVYNVDINDVDRKMRSNAKSVNFGIIYGISAFGLSQNIGISRGEAKIIIDQYFDEFPDIKAYMDKCIMKARELEYVETIFGRRRYLKDINSRNAIMRGAAERNAINAPIQGSAADIIKIAMITIEKELKDKNMQSRMIIQVHDELVFDMLPEEESDLRRIVKDSMSNACDLSVPLVIDIGTGANWLEAH